MKINEHLVRQISTALNFIEAHLKENINLEDMAQSASISLFHFARVFQFMTQISPYDYLIRRRIHEAGFELIHSKKKIIEIAFEYAFASPEVFNRAFKRIYNCQASQYRKNNQFIPHLHPFKPDYIALIHKYLISPIQKIHHEEITMDLQIINHSFNIDESHLLHAQLDCMKITEYLIIFDDSHLKGLWRAEKSLSREEQADQLLMKFSPKEYIYMSLDGGAKQIALAITYIHQIYAAKYNLKLGSYRIINKGSKGQEWDLHIPVISSSHPSGE